MKESVTYQAILREGAVNQTRGLLLGRDQFGEPTDLPTTHPSTREWLRCSGKLRPGCARVPPASVGLSISTPARRAGGQTADGERPSGKLGN
jgi:hypothetical protein